MWCITWAVCPSVVAPHPIFSSYDEEQERSGIVSECLKTQNISAAGSSLVVIPPLDKLQVGRAAGGQTDRHHTTYGVASPENSDVFNAAVDCRINDFFLFVFCAPLEMMRFVVSFELHYVSFLSYFFREGAINSS